jgi:hypothetical protein
MTDPIEAEIFNQLSAKGPGKSIEPADVAKVLQPEQWQRMLGRVRGVALGLAREGRLVITKKGKPVDLSGFKGVIRLRLPVEGDVLPPPRAEAEPEE